MSPHRASVHPKTRIRQAISALAAFGVAASIVFVGAPASAADVDLVVNVSTQQNVYLAEDVATYSVRVDNRGAQSTSVPSTVTLNVPNTRNTATAWEQSVTCEAFGGAVCPTSPFTRAGETISASIPSIPVAGYVVFTVRAPGEASNNIRGPVQVTATVAPQAGDVDLETSTDESFISVLIASPDMRYGTTVTGPSTAAAVSTQTYDVVISNDGSKNSVYANIALVAGAGSGSATTTPIAGLALAGVECVNESVAGLCANLRTVEFSSQLSPTQPNPITVAGTSARLGFVDMPAGSSATLRLTVNTGRPACNDAVGSANRTLTLSSGVRWILSRGAAEPATENSNNSGSVITNLPAPQCAIGDIATQSLQQPDAQASAGVTPGGPFSYTATYTNLSGSPALGAAPSLYLVWPGGEGTVMATPTCVATGSAVCPTSWNASGLGISGVGADIPVGGVLTITYTGTAGADDVTVCRPRPMAARASIQPPLNFRDTNYVPDGAWVNNAPSLGNNGRQLLSQANVGSPCTQSHDDAVQLTGPYTDNAATIPLNGPAVPGQVLYFRTLFTSIDPAPDFNTYSASTSVSVPYNNVMSYSESNRWVRHQAGDPSGLPYRDDEYSFGQGVLTVPFDTGVRCVASGGATCPTEVGGSGGASGGGGSLYNMGWSSYWKPGTQPAMPAGSSLSFISTYRIQGLDSYYVDSQCIPNGVAWGATTGTDTATIMNLTVRAGVEATTNPASADRATLNDSATTLVPVQITRCENTLEVEKTAVTETLPASRLAQYDIVVRNTSEAPLDLPRVIDIFQNDAPATIECTGRTLGALCPDFVPADDTRYFADGTTGPSTFRESEYTPTAQFDFVWGEAGEPTMPPGSSVTFRVSIQYPTSSTAASYNTVLFGADASAEAGPWPFAGAGASMGTASGSALVVSKSISKSAPRPGEVVTFTVDVVNSGATIPVAYLADAMHSLLLPTNPGGFGNLTCRAITAEDGVLRPGTAVGTTACPTFVSAPSGITGTIANFTANSGLRLTYTAVAPLISASIPNLATLSQSNTSVTAGDGSSKVNLLTMVTSVAGTIWNDANGSANGGFTGINNPGENPTNAGGLNAVLIDSATGNVLAVVPVGEDGTYLFPSVPVLLDVKVVLTTTSPTVGGPAGIPTLPEGWLGTSPLVQETFSTGTQPVTNKDFGIQRPPTTDDKTDPVVPNPGGDVRVQVPTLTGNDAEDGPLSTTNTFVIVTLPTNGTLYYDGELVTVGQVITDYDPTLLVVDPDPGAVTVVFTVAAVDAAGAVDATPATITMPFSVADAASISGIVWYDVNKDGVRDSGEVGIEGVTITLTGVDESGNDVTLTTKTDASGAWSFPNLAPGTYSVKETQPEGYLDGSVVLGSGANGQGSSATNEFTNIVLVGGDAAIFYNFGEVRDIPIPPVDPPVVPPVDPPTDPTVPVTPVTPTAPIKVLGATGFDATGFVGLAGLLMLLGAVGIGIATRRQERKSN